MPFRRPWISISPSSPIYPKREKYLCGGRRQNPFGTFVLPTGLGPFPAGLGTARTGGRRGAYACRRLQMEQLGRFIPTFLSSLRRLHFGGTTSDATRENRRIVCMDRGFERRRAVSCRAEKMGGNCRAMAVVEVDTYQHSRPVDQFPY